MKLDAELRGAKPGDLSHARSAAHLAVQHLSQAGRANLEAVADDSHSNLAWDTEIQGFRTHEMEGHFVELKLSPLTLGLSGPVVNDHTELVGLMHADAANWLDQRLYDAGLAPASSIELPYTLPDDVLTSRDAGAIQASELRSLAGWYSLAQTVLTELADFNLNLDPGPSQVRCWPHHFDIATYVSLESGDPESARGIGVGLSPGDSSYAEPYFYVNPWPHLSPGSLPPAVPPGHWHTDGFVGSIATATEVLSSTAAAQTCARQFVFGSFAASLEAMGIEIKR